MLIKPYITLKDACIYTGYINKSRAVDVCFKGYEGSIERSDLNSHCMKKGFLVDPSDGCSFFRFRLAMFTDFKNAYIAMQQLKSDFLVHLCHRYRYY